MRTVQKRIIIQFLNSWTGSLSYFFSDWKLSKAKIEAGKTPTSKTTKWYSRKPPCPASLVLNSRIWYKIKSLTVSEFPFKIWRINQNPPTTDTMMVNSIICLNCIFTLNILITKNIEKVRPKISNATGPLVNMARPINKADRQIKIVFFCGIHSSMYCEQ